MSPRAVPEWIGKSAATAIPQRVQDRVIARHDGHCPKCGRELRPGHFDFDHIVALVNGGTNRESNLWPLCKVPCHSEKTRDDVALKSKNYRRRAKHVGVKLRRRSSFQTNRDGLFRKRMDGTVERRR